MTAWPARREWERFPSEDLADAIATIEGRPVLDPFTRSTIAALRTELARRDPVHGPAPDSAGQGLAGQATDLPGNERTP